MKKGKRIFVYALAAALTVGLMQSGAAAAKKSSKNAINKKRVTLTAGTSVRLRVKGVSAKKVKWSSSKKSVAVVNKKGIVKGKKAGRARIIAKVGKKKYKCVVTVKAKSKSTAASSRVNWETVTSKFDDLADYIMGNGTETEEAIALIKTENTDEGQTTMQVSYDSEDEQIVFQRTESFPEGDSYFVSLAITKDEPETAAVECQIIQNGSTYIGTSEIEVAEYLEEEESLGFDFDAGTPVVEQSDTETETGEDSETGLSDDAIEELDSLGTDCLNDAIVEWDGYLQEISAGVSLADLGFISFEF
jgi:dipeptidyl aminopeptidase/acylaminoacyl peptidase